MSETPPSPALVTRQAVPATNGTDGDSDSRYCGAKRRQGGGPCRRPAGWGTDHSGIGRCKLHGGRNPVRHGRYSQIKREELRDAIARFEADPDPLNILPELAAARALFEDWINRYQAWSDAVLEWHALNRKRQSENERLRAVVQMLLADAPPNRAVPDIADGYRLLDEVSKIVTRIEKIRSENAISRKELVRVMTEMGRVVEAHNADPSPEARLEKIRDGWLSIRLG